MRGILGIIFTASLTFLIVVPILKFLTDPMAEFAHWHEAAALEDYLEGDLSAAIEHINEAIELNPDDASLRRRRADYLEQLAATRAPDEAADRIEDFEASLKDWNEAMRLAGENVADLRNRSNVLMKLGRYDAGIKDAQQIAALSAQHSRAHASGLNGLAYFRAVANRDLDKADEEIRHALRKLRSSNYDGRDAALVDTLGYIQYRRGDYKTALLTMNEAVAKIEAVYLATFGPNGYAKHLLGEFNAVDERELKIRKKEFAQSVAVIRYHRALVLKKLLQSQQASEDLQRVEELGFRPGKDLF